MVRRWFSITAVLAVAVLVLAVDASQGRERRLGRRWRGRSDAGYAASPYSYTEVASADTQADGRLANYYNPEGQGMSARARPVLLEVRVPANAEILIDGKKTMQKGVVRQFISPPIEPDRNYAYKLEAKWMDQGNERTRSQTVEVRAGQLVRVDLTKASPEGQKD